MEDLDNLAAAGRLCRGLADRLPTTHVPADHQSVVAPDGTPLVAKVPTKLLAAVGALAWRANDLAELSHELFERKRVVPAIVLARSVMECAALVYLIHKKTQQAIDAGTHDELDAFLVSCISGSRTDSTAPTSPNVLTAINHLEKEPGAENFSSFYHAFSEFAHPNAMGAYYAYATFDGRERRVSFGHNSGLTKADDAAFGLVFALEVLITFFDRTIALLPAVSALAGSRPGA